MACLVCKNNSPAILYTNSWKFDQYELNYYLLGILESFMTVGKEFIKWNGKQRKGDVEENNKKMCEECNEVKTKWLCRQCNVPFCQACFDKTHLASKTLRTHTYLEICKLFRLG